MLTGGAMVDAVWRRLLDRAGPRPGLPLTDDPTCTCWWMASVWTAARPGG